MSAPRAMLDLRLVSGNERAGIRGANYYTESIYRHWLKTGDYLTTAQHHGITTTQVIAAVHYELGRRERNSTSQFLALMGEE